MRNIQKILFILLISLFNFSCGTTSGGGDNNGSSSDINPPSTPNGFSVLATSSSQINLSWNPSSDNTGVTGYKIYKDGSFLRSVSTTFTSDSSLISSTSYCYTVSAYDSVGNESVQSEQKCATTPPVNNANDGLDESFGSGGMVIIDSMKSDSFYALTFQSDGKIISAGGSGGSEFSEFAAARFNADGSLDTTFGSSGIVTTDFGDGFFNTRDYANAVYIQTDGKIILAGTRGFMSGKNFALARYNANGSLDSTFGSDGKITTAIGWCNSCNDSYDIAHTIAVQSDGKIIIAGSSINGVNDNFAVVRYNADGSLDTTFGSDGKVMTSIGTLAVAKVSAIQPDNKILVAGYSFINNTYDFAVVRYTADGGLDTTFGSGGIVTSALSWANEKVNAIALQSDGKIVLAGFTTDTYGTKEVFALARYNADGSLDTTFGLDGKVTTNLAEQTETSGAYTVAIQSDDRIVTAGLSDFYISTVRNYDIAIVRYNADGSLDTTFGSDGKVITNIGIHSIYLNAFKFQPDNRLVAVGYYAASNTDLDFAIVRH